MAGRGKALSLYKSILRAHERYLPSAMRLMGDQYVKAEFRLHKTAKPDEVVHFYTEWEQYLAHIEQTGRENHSIDVGLVEPSSDPNGRRSFGKDIGRDLSFSDEQQTAPPGPATLAPLAPRSSPPPDPESLPGPSDLAP